MENPNINTNKTQENQEFKARPRYISEFSMGELDFLRWNEWLKYIEFYSAEVMSTDNPQLFMIQRYFSGINILWKAWSQFIVFQPTFDELNNNFDEVKLLKRQWETQKKLGIEVNPSLKNRIVDLLDNIHTRLMQLKQVIGLGIVVRRNFSVKQKIKLGMGLNENKFKGLPMEM
jgi:hypothetical protein